MWKMLLHLHINQNLMMLIISTFIKLPFVIQILILSIFERPFHTGFTVVAEKIVWTRFRGQTDGYGQIDGQSSNYM